MSQRQAAKVWGLSAATINQDVQKVNENCSEPERKTKAERRAQRELELADEASGATPDRRAAAPAWRKFGLSRCCFSAARHRVSIRGRLLGLADPRLRPPAARRAGSSARHRATADQRHRDPQAAGSVSAGRDDDDANHARDHGPAWYRDAAPVNRWGQIGPRGAICGAAGKAGAVFGGRGYQTAKQAKTRHGPPCPSHLFHCRAGPKARLPWN